MTFNLKLLFLYVWLIVLQRYRNIAIYENIFIEKYRDIAIFNIYVESYG